MGIAAVRGRDPDTIEWLTPDTIEWLT